MHTGLAVATGGAALADERGRPASGCGAEADRSSGGGRPRRRMTDEEAEGSMADTTETRKERRATARAEREQMEAARARTRRRMWQLGGALALAAAVVVAIVLATGGSDKPKLKAGEKVPGQAETAALMTGIPQKGIALGDPKAPVTLVEFADLQCPFCRDYTTTLMPTLIADYVRPGKVKMEFRNVAFIGTDSVRAAQMAAAVAAQNKLWTYVDLFYANQQPENSGYVTEDFLRKIGGGVAGLNVDTAMNDRGTAAVQTQLNDAQTLWTQNGFQGTPSFLLGRTGGTLKPLTVSAFELKQFSSKIDPLLK
jgi:protein-disulfide isomerase